MTKPIDMDRAKVLRAEWERKRNMWITEAEKLCKLAEKAPQKYQRNICNQEADAMHEIAKYARMIAELDAIIGESSK